jgi:hypothetical protein
MFPLQLLELKEPVVDAVGFVYERAAILDYIAKKGGRARCPEAGTSHHIAAPELRPARAVLAAKARPAGRAARGGARRQETAEVVDLE